MKENSVEALFGTVLRELRTKAGMSQEKLADVADLDRTYVSLLERGLRSPSLSTIFRISSALKILPSHFLKLLEGVHDEG